MRKSFVPITSKLFMIGSTLAAVSTIALAGCTTNRTPAADQGGPPARSTTGATAATAPTAANTVATADSSTSISTSTTVAPTPIYVFPFGGRDVSYGTTHHDYPAIDVFGCGATVLAPTSGVVTESNDVDRWDPAVDDPATRGGRYVSMLGDDGVRYYVAHLDTITVDPELRVEPGDQLGVMGRTGNARASMCHTHLGFSWPCDDDEWQVRRGEIWPWPYLDAWQTGDQLSPSLETQMRAEADPTACAAAIALVTPAG